MIGSIVFMSDIHGLEILILLKKLVLSKLWPHFDDCKIKYQIWTLADVV